MKKVYLLSLMLAASMMLVFQSCGSDDDAPDQSQFAKEYFSIDNAVYHADAMPASTADYALTGVDMNSSALAGGSNFISIESDEPYDRFYVGIEGQDGYLEVNPSSSRFGEYRYSITVNYGSDLSRNMVMIIKARNAEGKITKEYRMTVKYVESMDGELTINLTFDQKKDLDLHLLTPSGNHIYWGQREWTVETPDGRTIKYGLDHDSNANCDIDGLNNENIVIPEEAIEAGEYQVYLEMYKNCNKSIGTDLNWRLSVKYKGAFVKNTRTQRSAGENSMAWTDGYTTIESNTSPYNPVWGRYPYNHAGSTQAYVMNFTVKQGSRANNAPKTWCSYVPTLTDIAKGLDRAEGIE